MGLELHRMNECCRMHTRTHIYHTHAHLRTCPRGFEERCASPHDFQQLARIAGPVVDRVPGETFAGGQQVVVDELDFAHVFIGVVVDHKAHHAVPPSPGARFPQEAVLHADQFDALVCVEIGQHLRNGGHGATLHHSPHDVKHTVAVARVVRVHHRFLDDADDVFESLHQSIKQGGVELASTHTKRGEQGEQVKQG